MLDCRSTMRRSLPSWFVLAVLGGCAAPGDGPGDPGDGRTDGDAADRADAGDTGDCPAGRTRCPTGCEDLTSSPGNCGACGHLCGAGEVCNERVCASTCTAGLRNCSGVCVDSQTDEANCGSCGNACPATHECRAGGCVCDPQCAGRSCGPDSCGSTCPPGCASGYTCNGAGACACAGTPCGAACCTAGQLCRGGACCTPTCAGRKCGSDGCGGSCLPGCGADYTCTSGTCVRTSWVYEAEGPGMGHTVGFADEDGWAAATGSDYAEFMLYGPYATDIPAGAHSATWRLMVDNNTADTLNVVRLEVHDFARMSVLAQRWVRRNEFSASWVYQDFPVAFTSAGGASLEFRVWWTDISYVRSDNITVR